eukprot:TRINITY_DN782_c0_g1_i2.p1 TRINITY_DN782_c0_g1~~TRINITY_DN782_c0_g1_i2.p1  ORF type:complete len:193 (-),score=27.01 TRINITY_DN782_c0_g1_i2:235-813(-)
MQISYLFPRTFQEPWVLCSISLRQCLTLCPGKQQTASQSGINWNRDVEKDIQVLKEKYGTTVLVSLMQSWEYEALKVSHLPEVCSRNNIENLRYEWADGSLPPEEEWNTEFKNLVLAVHKKLLEGEKIIVHCMGGLGRTGTFAVCLLQLMNPEMDPEDSLEHVRKYRKNACENNLQKSFVLDQFPDLLEKWK